MFDSFFFFKMTLIIKNLSSLFIPNKNISTIIINTIMNNLLRAKINSFSKKIYLFKTKIIITDKKLTMNNFKITCFKKFKIDIFKHFLLKNNLNINEKTEIKILVKKTISGFLYTFNKKKETGRFRKTKVPTITWYNLIFPVA